LGHQYAFSVPLNRVWNVAASRHTRPSVGNAAVGMARAKQLADRLGITLPENLLKPARHQGTG